MRRLFKPRLFGGRWVKIFHIFPSSHYLLLTFFFAAGLELMFSLQRFFGWLLAAVLIVVAVGVAIIRAEEMHAFHVSQMVLPIMAALAMAGFALFLPATPIIHLYIALSAVIFYYLLRYGARQAYPSWRWSITLVIFFITTTTVLGWRFFLYSPLFLTLSIVAVAVFLLSWQLLMRFHYTTLEAVLVSAVLAFALTETVWVLQFLPLHYMVQAAIISALFYGIMQLLIKVGTDPLKQRDIIEQVGISGTVILLLLVTSQWL